MENDRLEYVVGSQMQRIGELHDEVEQLRDWSGGGDASGANTAVTSLLKIIADSGATTRQRIKAAAAVLGYKTEGDIAQFAKKFLTSVCESTDIAVDYKIEASELLRRCESPRIAPETVRPAYREAEPAEPPVPLLELVRQRRERADRMQEEMIRQYGWVDNSTGRKGSDSSMQHTCDMENKDTQEQ